MKINRRSFVQAGAAALMLPIVGRSQQPIAAIREKGSSRLRLALAAYSFREHFKWSRGKRQEPKGKAMDLFQFIDYCADHGCEGTELTSYFMPADADRAYFNQLKRRAFVRGVSVCGTAIGNNFSLEKGKELDKQIRDAKDWLDKAALLGAPHVRFFAGRAEEFDQGRDRIDNAIEALKVCSEYAGEKGIFIGVENHGRIGPDLLLEILESVDSPWLGINLDTGNFLSDDPYRDLERCVPYAVNVQVKVKMKDTQERETPADLDRIGQILRDGNYQGFVVLEYEEAAPLEEVPKYLDQLAKAIA